MLRSLHARFSKTSKRPILKYSTRARVTRQKLSASVLELNPGSPPTCQTCQGIDEALKVPCRSTLSLPPPAPHEKLAAMDSILCKFEKKPEPLRLKLQALRTMPEIRRPQDHVCTS